MQVVYCLPIPIEELQIQRLPQRRHRQLNTNNFPTFLGYVAISLSIEIL